MRELQWSAEVEVGVDQEKSDVKVTTGATRPDKKKVVTFVIVPRDRSATTSAPDARTPSRSAARPARP